ncbi:MAG: response regulator [Lachnospiraceae bacterium]|nr:response regulator [Lachnospiraceae bacterium]
MAYEKTYKVLIVEDDPMVAMINERYVARHPRFAAAGRVSDGKSAMAWLQKNAADLVILDVYMPVMNGVETLEALRAAGNHVPVIMVTAANDAATFEAVMRLGAVDYLVKPFSFERFTQALDRFLDRASALEGGNKRLSQEKIDRLMGAAAPAAAEELPKGIQEKTKELLLQTLAAAGDYLTGEELAEQAGVSVVTVRRYMNHLIRTGEAEGVMNYETGGRPSMLYRGL